MGSSQRWWEPSLNDSDWDTVQIGASENGSQKDKPLLTWYRVHLTLPGSTPNVWAPWKIRLDASGNGFLYINGKPLGRYWEVGPQRDFFLPGCWVKKGDNVLTISLRTTGEAPMLRYAALSVYADQAELRLDRRP